MKTARSLKATPARTCAFCGGPHDVSAAVAQESPFCSNCLHDRIALRAERIGPVTLLEVDEEYVMVMPLQRGTPGSVPS